MNMRNPFATGRVGKKCSQDPNTGELQCKIFRVNKDGTEETMAQGRWTRGNDGKPIILESEENEPGSFAELEKHVLPRLKVSDKRNIP